ncbi:MAG TPA: hypothetical protein VFL94_01565, partial [Actinomycetales bacterium]|nr:hypothetical protein [Actinomycetales bacterium]
ARASRRPGGSGTLGMLANVIAEAAARPGDTALDRLVVILVRAQGVPVVGRCARLILLLLGVHVPAAVRIGRAFSMPHATGGVVIHPATTIGDRVTMYHGVTIGRADGYKGADPSYGGVVIEDEVVLCTGAVILGRNGKPTIVRRGTVVGANAVLSTSTGAGETWAGSPATRIR